jgi:hypothetical protein
MHTHIYIYCIRIIGDSNLHRHKLLLVKSKRERSNLRSVPLISSMLYQREISSITFFRIKLTYVVFVLKNMNLWRIHVCKDFFSFSASISFKLSVCTDEQRQKKREREREGEKEKARKRETASCCTNTNTHLSDPFPARSPDSNRTNSLITIHSKYKVD